MVEMPHSFTQSADRNSTGSTRSAVTHGSSPSYRVLEASADSGAIDRLALPLLAAYVVALLAVPSDVGLDLGFVVLSPGRLLLMAATVVAGISWARHRVSVPRTMVAILSLWLVFLMSAMVSTVVNGTAAAISRLGSMILEGVILFTVTWFVGRRDGLDRTLEQVAVVTTAAVAAVTLALAMNGYRYDTILYQLAGGTLEAPPIRLGFERQQGPFDAPLYYAGWLLAVTPIVIGRAFDSSGRRRTSWIAAWAVLALATLSTLSRAAIIGLPAILAVSLAMRGRRGGAAAASLATVCLVIVMSIAPTLIGGQGPVVPGDGVGSGSLASPTPIGSGSLASPTPIGSGSLASPTPSPTTKPAQDLDNSNQARIEALKAAIGAVEERPLFGWGPLSAKEVAKAQLGKGNFVDSTYLVLLIETGIVGLLAFLALAGTILWSAARILPEPLTLARLLSSVSILGFCVLLAFLATSQGYAAFWLLMGILAARALGGAGVLAGSR